MKIRGNRLITMLLLCLTWTGCSSRQANPLVQAETSIQEEALPGSETKQEAQANPPQGPDFEDLLIQTPGKGRCLCLPLNRRIQALILRYASPGISIWMKTGIQPVF